MGRSSSPPGSRSSSGPRRRSSSPPESRLMARGSSNGSDYLLAVWKKTTDEVISSVEQQIRRLFEADQNRGLEAMMVFNPRIETVKSRRPSSIPSAENLFRDATGIRADLHRYLEGVAKASKSSTKPKFTLPPAGKSILRKTGTRKSPPPSPSLPPSSPSKKTSRVRFS